MAATDAPTTPPAGPGDPPAAGQVPASTEAAGVAAPSQGQAPTNGEPSGTDAGEGNVQVDPAELQRRLDAAEQAATNARNEAARHRRALREAQEAERARAAEGQSDEERRAAEAQEREEFEQERTQFRLERGMAQVGAELKLVDPDAALWLLDWNQIDFDDEGKPTNLKPLTEALIKEKPYLVAAVTTPPATPVAPTIGASAGAAVAGPAPSLTAQELAFASASGMDPERYARLKNVKTLDDYKKVTPGPAAQA